MANLKDTLKRLEGKDVSIGTAQGHNFIYIGRADNVELIAKIFAEYHDKIENKKIPGKKKDICAMMRSINKKGKLVDQAKEIAKMVESLENYEDYIAGYVDPMHRNIVEIFESDPAIGEPIRVIVTGREVGEFWFKSEFDLKYGNK